MILQCKKCGCEFNPPKEDVEMWEDGYCELTQICEDCIQDENNQFQDCMNDFSDADCGL